MTAREMFEKIGYKCSDGRERFGKNLIFVPHGRLIDLDKFLKEYPQFVLIPASSILLENEPVIEAEE